MAGGRLTRGCRRPLRVIVPVLVLLAVGCSEISSGASTGLAATAPVTTLPDGTFPLDEDVRIVTLPNGLTAYLRHNETPGFNAELRLVVNAGSVNETAEQSGVAHFLEHMMFNGTTSWPSNELIDQLREFGMEFGADVNAYTSYDETVYQLAVPAGPGERSVGSPIEVGLDILAEWLSAGTLDPAEVDAEIGVVLDEWRTDQSFAGRLGDTVADLYLSGSAYHDHPPIGTAEAIESMTAERLRAFYDAWYRPDNAAVVVVGDINLDIVEAIIESSFGSLEPRGDAPVRPDAALRPFDRAAAAVFTDPDTEVTDIELALPALWQGVDTPEHLRSAVLDDIALEMLATRLGDDVARGQAAFAEAYRSDNSMVRDLHAPSVVVTADIDGVDAAIHALLIEFERADRFGFSAAELERAVAPLRSDVASRYDARDSTGDAEFTEQYVQHFLVGDPPLAAAAERTVLTDLYDSITPEEVSQAFSCRYHQSGSHLLLVAPESTAGALPTVDALLERLAARSALVVEPRVDSAPVEGELMARPEPVIEASADELPDDEFSFLEPTLLTFDNGARVVLNPSEISDDSVVLSATSPGGLSLVADADVPDALQAVEVVTTSGLGSLDPVQFDTILSASSVELYPYLDVTAEGFAGSSTTDDVETMLKILAMYFEQPRFDQVALDSTIDSWLPYVDDPTGDPDMAVYVTYVDARYGGEPRYAAVPTTADLDVLDLPTIEKVWRERFSSPGDWAIAISGDFDLDEMTDLVRRYIGSLPGDERAPEVAVDLQPPPPDGVVSTDVRAGSGEKAALSRIFEAPLTEAELATQTVVADLASAIISNRLTDRVREEVGASYSPYGYSTVYTDPDLLIETVIEATGDPEHIDELTDVVAAQLEDLRSAGPSTDEFDDAMAATEQQYDLFDDNMLVSVLLGSVFDEHVLTDFIDRRDTLREVDLGDVRAFLTRALPADRYIEVRLLPA